MRLWTGRYVSHDSHENHILIRAIQSQRPLQPLFFHSCFNHADLAVTSSLVELLDEEVPTDPLFASSFDLWLHQAIFPISDIAEAFETFNRV
jgi:hypothetical protein